MHPVGYLQQEEVYPRGGVCARAQKYRGQCCLLRPPPPTPAIPTQKPTALWAGGLGFFVCFPLVCHSKTM